MNYELNVTNEIITEAKTKEEIIEIFNDKLADLIIMYEEEESDPIYFEEEESEL